MQVRALTILLVLLFLFLSAGCSDDEPGLEPLEGDIRDISDSFLEELVRERYDIAYSFFNEEVRKILSEEELQNLWEQMRDHVGLYEETVHQRHQIMDGNDIITLTAIFELKQMEVLIMFDDDNRISGFWLNPDR